VTVTAPEAALEAEAVSAGSGTAPRPRSRSDTWVGFAIRQSIIPVVCAIICIGLYEYIQNQTLDSIEQRTVNATYIHDRLIEHIKLTALASLLIVAIAVPLGILLTRRRARALTPFVLAAANIGQATPAIGLLVLLTLAWQPGFKTALIGLIAYSVLPVLRNTVVGIQQVDRSLVDAGRGMGMTGRAVLARVELPLAVPIILAGIRTALVLSVGVATLATFVNAGGLGDLINNGIKLDRTPVLVTGSLLAVVLALAFDWFGGLVEDLLRPRGL
jgi:osmoprotectant transport system permease protein